MNRRTFIGSLTGGLLAAPLGAEGQQAGKVPRIGLLRPGAPTDPADRSSVGAFSTGLQEVGYTQGTNIRVEARYAHGQFDRLPALARELIALPVDVIVTSNPYATRAAREATRTVPIVVALDYESDPVANAWIASIARLAATLPACSSTSPRWPGSCSSS
jgi:putative ABC transport system substrate-binding protein